MRLRRYNPNNINVESTGAGGRGRFPGGGGGKVGLGTIIIALIAYFVFGADPQQFLGSGQNSGNGQMSQSAGSQLSEEQACNQSEYALEACNALSSLNETWEPIFAANNVPFKAPGLNLFRDGRVNTGGCGSATSAAGPFYCPADQKIYIDTSFYDMMAQRMGAGGDFARYYVIAHEYGHHIQTVTGLSEQIRSAQAQNPRASNQLQVRMELQADCYAGVWASKNRNAIEPGDLEEGLTAAAAIGDDTLQRNAGQRINPEAFTHGTSEQRMQWLRTGLRTGDSNACDTFSDLRG